MWSAHADVNMSSAPPPQEPQLTPAAVTAAPLSAPETPTAPTTPFQSTEERRFELYMHERENYTKGARDAYQRFDQTIVALSGGSIVLSITFMKDIGHIPSSLPWLFAAWGSFLVASLCAFISLLTSAETDRERRKQLDCTAWEGQCDETKAERFGRITTGLNYAALTTCILGVILIIVFATYNLMCEGGERWPKEKAKAERSLSETSSGFHPELSGTATSPTKEIPGSTSAKSPTGGPQPALPSPSPTETQKPGSPPKPIQGTQSQDPSNRP